MFNMFKAKIAAIIAGLLTILTFIIKSQKRKIDKLEKEEKIREKIDEVEADQEAAAVEILKTEGDRINEDVKSNKSNTRRSRASKL